MDAALSKFEQASAQLRISFLETSRDRLDEIETLLFSKAPVEEESLLKIFRDVHSLKGSGATYGLPSISMIAHRFEDYLSTLPAIEDECADDILLFVDALRGVIARGKDPRAEILRETMRALPASRAPELEVDAPLDIEILLVSPSSSVRQILTRDLRACGYVVTAVETPWKVLQMAVCARPDLIITSVVMDGMNGVDLTNALGAIAATQDIPVAVLTSFTDDHPELDRLPGSAPLIRTGESFQDDLADALTKKGIA